MEQDITNKAVAIANDLKKDFCKNDALAIIEITKILIENSHASNYQ